MDNNSNWRPNQAGEPPLENVDWRIQLQTDSRQRIVNKIMETLKRHLPFSGQEGLQELKKIAVRFEEKIYSAATSQSDYLRRISLKMLTMENKSNPMPNPMQSNSAGSNMNSPDPALQGMQSQINNSAQMLPIPLATNNQSQTLLGQNTINNSGVVSTGLQGPSSSLSQNSITNVNVQNSNMQNISGISQNPSAYANSQRQQVRQQQQPQSSQQQYLYQQQQQLQHQLMKQKFNNIPQFQQQQQQQQQQQPNNNNNNNLLQSNQLQSSQQSLMQPPAIQQNQQQPSVQQTTPPVLQQSVLRQQRQQPTILQQQSVLPAQQQQQQQQPHLMQQNQLNDVTDMQQQRLIGQKNNNMQQQQQMMMNQPNNLANMQQHMVQQSKVSVQQSSSNLLQPSQSQQSHSQQMVSNMQSQQMSLQQQQPDNSIQTQQKIQMLQQQNLTDQQKQIFQSHRPNPEASSTSLDSTDGNTNGGDWQDDIFQKIKLMKDTYLVELTEMYQKVSGKLQQHDSVSQLPKNDQYDKLRMFKQMMERLISFLQVQKQHIIPSWKDKLGQYEKQIVSVLSQQRPRKQVSLPPTHMHSMQQQQQQPHSQPQVHDKQLNPQISTMNLQNNSMSPLPGVVPYPQMMNMLQETNMSSLHQQNPNSLIKQEQQQPMQTQQMKHQQFQQRQMQQQFMQKQQLLQQQAKLHQMSDGSNSNNDMKMRQQMGNVKPQQQQQQRAAFHHQQQIKQGSPFSISSPQLLQSAGSPQISQHHSPQIDQQNLLNSLTKAGTPLQNVNSPLIAASPSTPLVPSPMPGESDKHQQQTSRTLLPAQSLAIGTPGISASPLLAEFTGTDGNNGTTLVSATKSSVAEQPLDRLLKAVNSMSPQALSGSVNDIGSVVSMIDRIAGSAPGNGSRAAVGEDLVAMTKCRLQARNFVSQDGSNHNNNTATRKMKRCTSAMPLNVASSADAGDEDLVASDVSALESTETSNAKKPRLKANHAIVEEIREINQRLIDTVVEISDEDINPTAAGEAAINGHEGTVVKCSFSALALGPNLKSHYASSQMSPIQPLRLLLPTSYPNGSPIILDKFPVEEREHEDLSVKAKSRFSISLRGLSQPISLGEIAKTWGICARAVISEYAQQSGGGSFSSKYGSWENCLSAA